MQLLHSGKHLAKSIYGIIITGTLLITLEGHEDNAWSVAVIIVLGIFAVILAEYYSTLFGKKLDRHSSLTLAERVEVVKDCLFMLVGTVMPVLLFVLAGLGIIKVSLAYELAEIWVTLLLFGYGYLFGRVSEHTHIKSVLYGAANVCLVILIVFVKSLLH